MVVTIGDGYEYGIWGLLMFGDGSRSWFNYLSYKSEYGGVSFLFSIDRDSYQV